MLCVYGGQWGVDGDLGVDDLAHELHVECGPGGRDAVLLRGAGPERGRVGAVVGVGCGVWCHGALGAAGGVGGDEWVECGDGVVCGAGVEWWVGGDVVCVLCVYGGQWGVDGDLGVDDLAHELHVECGVGGWDAVLLRGAGPERGRVGAVVGVGCGDWCHGALGAAGGVGGDEWVECGDGVVCGAGVEWWVGGDVVCVLCVYGGQWGVDGDLGVDDLADELHVECGPGGWDAVLLRGAGPERGRVGAVVGLGTRAVRVGASGIGRTFPDPQAWVAGAWLPPYLRQHLLHLRQPLEDSQRPPRPTGAAVLWLV